MKDLVKKSIVSQTFSQREEKDYQKGCVETSRHYMQLIEESLTKIYKDGNAVAELQELQKKCREALITVLDQEKE